METMSEEQRPALGRPGRLGAFYDIRCDQVRLRSFLKPTHPPPGSVIIEDGPTMEYKMTSSDSLEEKFSKLDISADLGGSILSGALAGGWGTKYLRPKKTSVHVQQMSVICTIRSQFELLKLESDELKDCLDFDALDTTDATHVICGIDWGARTLVTASKAVEKTDGKHDFETKLELQPPSSLSSSSSSSSSVEKQQKGIMRRFADFVIKTHGEGSLRFNTKLESFDKLVNVEIIADIANHSNVRIPKDCEDLTSFQSVQTHLQGVNGGKGVPVTFHLRSIDDIARSFKIPLKRKILVRRLDKDCIDSLVKHVDELQSITQQLKDYEALVQNHKFCVPHSQLQRAQEAVERATAKEDSLQRTLRSTISRIRDGSGDTQDLQNLLQGVSRRRDHVQSLSILNEYVDKMNFANVAKSMGAEYIHTAQWDKSFFGNETRDLFVLHYNEATRNFAGWEEHRQTLVDLLETKDQGHRVLIVDYDLPTPHDLDKAYIEKHRCGKVIVPNVVDDMRSLKEECIVMCDDDTQIDRSRFVTPPPRERPLNIPCPGTECFDGGDHHWKCPTCRSLVSYEVTDGFLYCRCSRYPSSSAVFKCNSALHGPTFAKYMVVHLQDLLDSGRNVLNTLDAAIPREIEFENSSSTNPRAFPRTSNDRFFDADLFNSLISNGQHKILSDALTKVLGVPPSGMPSEGMALFLPLEVAFRLVDTLILFPMKYLELRHSLHRQGNTLTAFLSLIMLQVRSS